MTRDTRPERDWTGEATFEATRRWQMTLALSATPAQRLAWLEEMIALAHSCGATRKEGQPLKLPSRRA